MSPGSAGQLHVLKTNANLLPLAAAKSKGQKRESLGRAGALPWVTPWEAASLTQLGHLANISRKNSGNDGEKDGQHLRKPDPPDPPPQAQSHSSASQFSS